MTRKRHSKKSKLKPAEVVVPCALALDNADAPDNACAPASDPGIAVDAASASAAAGAMPQVLELPPADALQPPAAAAADDAVLDAPHGALGQRLRAAREARGWSRAEVGARLKLPPALIGKLETDTYEGLAHSVYLRGYLTAYTRLLGLPRVLVDSVLVQHSSEAPVLVQTGTVSRSRYLYERYSVAATYLILTGLIVAPAVWLTTHGGLEQNLTRIAPLDGSVPMEQVDRADPANPASLASTGELRIAASTLAPSSAPAPEPAAAAPRNADLPLMASLAAFPQLRESAAPTAPSSAPVIGAGSHTLRMQLSEASWVEVLDAGGRRLEYGLLPAGSERHYQSELALQVRIGNASGAVVEADGKVLDLAPFQRSNVARFKLFAGTAASAPTDS